MAFSLEAGPAPSGWRLGRPAPAVSDSRGRDRFPGTFRWAGCLTASSIAPVGDTRVSATDVTRGMLDAVDGSAGDGGVAFDREELRLVERARTGDREAFDYLVQGHLRRVWRVVWRVLRHHEDTEDVVQEVFLAAYQSLPGFRGESRFSTWLHRIAVTRALNHLDRAAERIRRASGPLAGAAGGASTGERDDHPVGEWPASGPSLLPSPLQALEAQELRRRLAECLSRLPAAWRAVVALRDGESRPYEEMAHVLGIALGTARSPPPRRRRSRRPFRPISPLVSARAFHPRPARPLPRRGGPASGFARSGSPRCRSPLRHRSWCVSASCCSSC